MNVLIYLMGLKADNVFDCPKTTPKDKFDDNFFTVCQIERAKFNMQRQGETESVDEFITDLYAIAKYCEHGGLHNTGQNRCRYS